MLRIVVAIGLTALTACKPVAPVDNLAAEANAVAGEAVNAAFEAEPAPPPYVAGPDDAKGENEVANAIPGELHYRDLPAARLFRGDWTVEKVEWFAVGGSDTPARSPAKMKALAGAHVRIDRQLIEVTTLGDDSGDIELGCSGVSYIDKDRLVASAHLPERANNGISREDVLRDYGIAVAEKELVERLPGRPSADGQVLSIYCSDNQGHEVDDVEDYGAFSGALLLDRDHMVLLYNDGTALFMKRDAQ
jgi:hypothetical protein